MKKVICWISGGITSAISCKIALEIYGKENCRFIFIDTGNEHEDTYRFINELCDKLGVELETLRNLDYDNIEEVWYKYKSLNVATGAICSSKLKRDVREKWQKNNEWSYQVFGFDVDEIKRVRSMTLNNPQVNAIYPLLLYGLRKQECFDILENELNIKRPIMYDLGFDNNNCFGTGCVQGGQKYWLKWLEVNPEKFYAMAKHEHELTNQKGEPVTILKCQKKESLQEVVKYKQKWRNRMFLIPHPDYPMLKSLIELREDEIDQTPTDFECNGFCGINDGQKWTEQEKEEFNAQLTLI